jgi:hypothetical protein
VCASAHVPELKSKRRQERERRRAEGERKREREKDSSARGAGLPRAVDDARPASAPSSARYDVPYVRVDGGWREENSRVVAAGDKDGKLLAIWLIRLRGSNPGDPDAGHQPCHSIRLRLPPPCIRRRKRGTAKEKRRPLHPRRKIRILRGGPAELRKGGSLFMHQIGDTCPRYSYTTNFLRLYTPLSLSCVCLTSFRSSFPYRTSFFPTEP